MISFLVEVERCARNSAPQTPKHRLMRALLASMWPIGKLIPYARDPRKNDSAVSQTVASIREFGFKIPCLVRRNGEVADDHLLLKAAWQLAIAEVPAILCDEWTPAQVKAFRLMVNRSVTSADWELLALELADLQMAEFDLSLTGFNEKEIEALMLETNLAEDEVAPVPAGRDRADH